MAETDMTDSLLQQGLNLMSFGMGTVFVFLAILVVTTIIMSRLIERFVPEPVEPQIMTPRAVASTAVDGKVLKVIQAALDQHRDRK